ncbi:MAG: hypothetical protein Q4P66_03030 [Actinomycetaceae bacterium]|nr:hypothetical protein [Actinomycetaceae bacterium]
MFTTLMKYEWIATRRMFGFIAGISWLIVACIGVFQTFMFEPLSSLIFGISLVVSIGTTFVCSVVFVYEYFQSMYGRRGYFTHSLPVKGRTIVAAKTVYYIIVMLVVAVTFILQMGFAILMYQWDRGVSISTMLSSLSDIFVAANALPITFITIIVLLGIIEGVLFWEFAITVGNRPMFAQLGKVVGPIIVVAVTQIVTQIVSVIMIVFAPGILTFNESAQGAGGWSVNWTISISSKLMASQPTDAMVPLGIFIALLLYIVFFWWATVRSVERATSLR